MSVISINVPKEILLDLHENEDDFATPDDLAAIQAAHEEYARGETVSHNNIDWN